MKVQSIQQGNTFLAKPKALSQSQLYKAHDIIDKMYAETVNKSSGDKISSTLLLVVKDLENKRFIQNNRLFTVRPECKIGIKKSELTFDAQTGEIKRIKKPFFKTWNGLMKNVTEFLDFVLANFDNNKELKKVYLEVLGFTKEGIEKLRGKK